MEKKDFGVRERERGEGGERDRRGEERERERVKEKGEEKGNRKWEGGEEKGDGCERETVDRKKVTNFKSSRILKLWSVLSRSQRLTLRSSAER